MPIGPGEMIARGALRGHNGCCDGKGAPQLIIHSHTFAVRRDRDLARDDRVPH
jgi:hypothetical protein